MLLTVGLSQELVVKLLPLNLRILLDHVEVKFLVPMMAEFGCNLEPMELQVLKVNVVF